MNRTRMLLVTGSVVIGALLIATLWSAAWMLEQRKQARYAAEDLATSQVLADYLAKLRDQPTIAAAQDMGIQELGDRIAAAQRLSGLNASAVQGVYPQTAREIRDTPYRIKPTNLTIQSVRLPQFAAFLYHLTEGSGLNVQRLTLSAPRGSEQSMMWDADVTLTYLIYTPPTGSAP